MKSTRLSLATLSSALFLVSAFFACEPQESNQDQTLSPVNASVNALVELSEKKGATAQEITSFAAQYKRLSFDQLETYNELMYQRELSKATGDVELKANLDKARSFQKQVNAQTMKAYNQPYNQLTSAQIDALLDKADAQTPSANGRLAASCPLVTNWPYGYSRGFGAAYVRRSNEILRVANKGTDCDYQYAFSTINYSKLHPFNPGTTNIINYYGSLLARRVNGYTYVLIGNRAIALYFGGNANGVDLYLGT